MPEVPVLEIERGVRFDQIIECFDDLDQTTRTPLAGYQLILQARPRAGVDDLILDLRSDDGTGRLTIETATDGPVGEWLRVKLNAAQTEAVTQKGVWGIARVSPDAPLDVDAIAEGVLELKPKLIDVTPPA